MKVFVLAMLACTVGVQVIQGAGDSKCISRGGRCQMTSSRCSGGRYSRNLCAGVTSRQCCIKIGGDSKCTSRSGRCQMTWSSCSGGRYSRNLCAGVSSRQCCIKSGSTTGRCSSSTAKQKACSILSHHRAGRITLANRHPSGVRDQAYPLKNIQDACNGRRVSRSRYTCRECRNPGAPGGTVCLSAKLLTYLDSLARLGNIYVTSIAGACHSCNSRHYRGLAVDLRRQGRFSEYIRKCNSMGGRGIDERTHIHCQL
ncbi:hypothetical protein SNE40_007397 [Patella caerulea]|uniref:Uncharacterized protein n=1 Tax=Patella caerulea TaxID=87958 RepID=A0AAN8JYE6_PATCE